MSRENKLSAMAAQKFAEGGKPVIAVCVQTLSKERKTESGWCESCLGKTQCLSSVQAPHVRYALS